MFYRRKSFPFCVGLGENPCIHGDAGNGGLAHIGVTQVLTFEEASQNGPVELLPMGCCDTTRVLSTSKCDLIAFTPAPQDWEKSQEGFHCVSALQYEDVTCVVCQQQLGYPAVSEEEQFGSLNVPGQMVAEHSEASGQMVEDPLGQTEVLGEEVSGQMVLGQPEALGKVEEGQCLSSSTSQELKGECGEGSSTGELQRRSSDSAVPLNRSRLPTPRTQLKKCSTFSRSVSHLSLMILNAFVILSSFLPSLPPFLPPFLPPCLPPSPPFLPSLPPSFSYFSSLPSSPSLLPPSLPLPPPSCFMAGYSCCQGCYQSGHPASLLRKALHCWCSCTRCRQRQRGGELGGRLCRTVSGQMRWCHCDITRIFGSSVFSPGL